MKRSSKVIRWGVGLGFISLVVGIATAEPKGERGERKRGGGEAMLKMLDADGDGMVSKLEMLTHFDEVDGNGDGLLSLEEMKTHRETRKKARQEQKEMFKNMTAEERFADMDKDASGDISSEEFRGKRKGVFSKMDSDHSGGVSLEEFKVAHEKRKEGNGRKGKDRGFDNENRAQE